MTQSEQFIASRIGHMVVMDALLMKGLLTYADVQESIAAVRETIPKHLYTPLVAQILDIMEQTYQSGRYRSPLPRQGEP